MFRSFPRREQFEIDDGQVDDWLGADPGKEWTRVPRSQTKHGVQGLFGPPTKPIQHSIKEALDCKVN